MEKCRLKNKSKKRIREQALDTEFAVLMFSGKNKPFRINHLTYSYESTINYLNLSAGNRQGCQECTNTSLLRWLKAQLSSI